MRASSSCLSAWSKRARAWLKGSTRWRARSISPRSRNLSSPAAFSVNVTATIRASSPRPDPITDTIRFTSAVVLPVPAAASITSVTPRSSRIRSRTAWSDMLLSGTALAHLAQPVQRFQARFRFDSRAPLLVRAADALVVAPFAFAIVRCGGQKPRFQRLLDDRHEFTRRAPRLVVDFNHALLVAAGRSAIVKPPGENRLAQHAFGRQRVQDR